MLRRERSASRDTPLRDGCGEECHGRGGSYGYKRRDLEPLHSPLLETFGSRRFGPGGARAYSADARILSGQPRKLSSQSNLTVLRSRAPAQIAPPAHTAQGYLGDLVRGAACDPLAQTGLRAYFVFNLGGELPLSMAVLWGVESWGPFGAVVGAATVNLLAPSGNVSSSGRFNALPSL